jgi:hypothetical protein
MDSKFPAVVGFTCDKAGLTDAVLRAEISEILCVFTLCYFLMHIFSPLGLSTIIIGLCVGHMLVIFNVDIFKGTLLLSMRDTCLYYYILIFTNSSYYIAVLSYDTVL